MNNFPAIYLKWSLVSVFFVCNFGFGQAGARIEIDLDNNWRTIAGDSIGEVDPGFFKTGYDDSGWKMVDVPHNWDKYEGYRRLRHGNKHGYALYRKSFQTEELPAGKRYFLYFEGVGSYATVWLNGQKIGTHAGGRTSFTIDATPAIQLNGPNLLAVRADHPAFIKDLPWICGGCSDDRGWSEGSQPMGIFRPVHLVITGAVRIQPFGVQVWTRDKNLTAHPVLNLKTTVRNYGKTPRKIILLNKLLDADGKLVTSKSSPLTVNAATEISFFQQLDAIHNPQLWSPENPYLYQVVTEVLENGKLVDRLETPYGIRWVTWPSATSKNKQFLVNNKPVFINGTCEYEHLMGRSHAFDSAQIRARVTQVRAAGFNAFRDAHQPHNLLYNKYWNELGILNWTQFSAHAWYDTPEFRENFKKLLTDWVKERRNDPAVVMWGLQNESKLPEDFAKECTALIRKLDPTASTQRPVTTCNGGEGTDWNVPQNWSGTYGGDPSKYGEELKKELLVGEYGAWRTLDLHTEGGFDQDGIYSEDRMTQLMEMKVRLAESVKDSVAGHFHWLFSSHENPGRVQSGEGDRELDRVGPINYKGLFTPWGEPLDAFYMYRANYTSGQKQPMVYIVSHTWPDRWLTTGVKDSITIYSNCEEVELFNDLGNRSLGTKTRDGIGTHFQWDKAPIQYNVLYAEGRINGKTVARDTIVLHHLPKAPGLEKLEKASTLTDPEPGYHYLYRVNCGGPVYTDHNGNTWLRDAPKQKDATWGSLSWTDSFHLPAFYASQRFTNDAIGGSADWPLFQNFRYGMDKLRYEFPVKNGEYLVELYFVEPWYGTGGGIDCTGWRLFDVAINDQTVLKDLDLWKVSGHNHAVKKTFKAMVNNGKLVISFPKAAAGEAIISAIAVATVDGKQQAAAAPLPLITNFSVAKDSAFKLHSWLNTGTPVYSNSSATFSALPPILYGAEWIAAPANIEGQQGVKSSFVVSRDADVFIGLKHTGSGQAWLTGYSDANGVVETDEAGGTKYQLYKKRFGRKDTVNLGSRSTTGNYLVFATAVSGMEPAYDQKPVIRYEAETARLEGAAVAAELFANKKYVTVQQDNGSIEWSISPGVADRYALHFRYINPTGNTITMQMKVIAADGAVMQDRKLEFPQTASKWATVDSDTGTYINAGNYKVLLSASGSPRLGVDYLEVQ